MCRYLTINRRQDDGSISAKCAIKEQNSVSECSLCINRIYKVKTKRIGLANNECQFYYYGIEQENPYFIKECPCYDEK